MNNPFKGSGDQAAALAHRADNALDGAIRTTQSALQQGADRLGGEPPVTKAYRQLVREGEAIASHGMDVVREGVREGAHQVQERSQRLRDATANYVQHEPVKSMLVAAAAGAALFALMSLWGRGRGTGR